MKTTATLKKKLIEARKAYEKLGKFVKLDKGNNIELTLVKSETYTFKVIEGIKNFWQEGQELLKLHFVDSEDQLFFMEKPMISSLAKDFITALENELIEVGKVNIVRLNDDNGTYVIEYWNNVNNEFERM